MFISPRTNLTPLARSAKAILDSNEHGSKTVWNSQQEDSVGDQIHTGCPPLHQAPPLDNSLIDALFYPSQKLPGKDASRADGVLGMIRQISSHGATPMKGLDVLAMDPPSRHLSAPKDTPKDKSARSRRGRKRDGQAYVTSGTHVINSVYQALQRYPPFYCPPYRRQTDPFLHTGYLTFSYPGISLTADYKGLISSFFYQPHAVRLLKYMADLEYEESHCQGARHADMGGHGQSSIGSLGLRNSFASLTTSHAEMHLVGRPIGIPAMEEKANIDESIICCSKAAAGSPLPPGRGKRKQKSVTFLDSCDICDDDSSVNSFTKSARTPTLGSPALGPGRARLHGACRIARPENNRKINTTYIFKPTMKRAPRLRAGGVLLPGDALLALGDNHETQSGTWCGTRVLDFGGERRQISVPLFRDASRLPNSYSAAKVVSLDKVKDPFAQCALYFAAISNQLANDLLNTDYDLAYISDAVIQPIKDLVSPDDLSDIRTNLIIALTSFRL